MEPSASVDRVAAHLLDAAIEVHRVLGPGLLEAVYQDALQVELTLRGVAFVSQPWLRVAYKGHLVGEARPDLIVEDAVVVELKAVDQLDSVHLAQAMSYLRITRLSLALVVNFDAPVLLRGVRRVVLSKHR